MQFATGLRNMEALRYDPARGALFGLQHGRDHLNDNWPTLFTPQQGADLPSEEFVRIDEPSPDWEVFADGFIGEASTAPPRDAAHRPMGLAEGHDGSLYISDDVGGRVWRVVTAR